MSAQQQPLPSSLGTANAQQQQQSQQQQQQQQYQAGYGQAGYFSAQNQYPSQYPPQTVDYGNGTGLASSGSATGSNTVYQPRPNAQMMGSSTDPNTGLAHQFSHQNLGGAARGAPYGSRGPSASQRPRTAGGSAAHPAAYGNYLNTPVPSQPIPRPEFQPAPERSPDRYGPNANNNQKKCSQLAADFFKDSVKRARERNQRYVPPSTGISPLSSLWGAADTVYSRQSEMEQKLSEPNQSAARKEQIWSTAGRREGSYLRFLRTKDKPENYTTVKIIGKGAFGEVKLVQKKADNKVYAMKSLVKTEMFKRDQLAHVRAERDILAESDSPWVVKLYTTFQDANFLYMLMEFLPGGDLMTMLIKYEIFSEDITRFYIAEIVLAIEAVHKLGFIHRYVWGGISKLPCSNRAQRYQA